MILTNEEGGITVIVISLCIALLSCISLLGFAVNRLITANRLNNSADRVALGAATQLVSSPENSCAIAGQLALNNQVELVQCQVNDDEVMIKVATDSLIQSWLDIWWQIGQARAGVDYIYD